MTFSDKLIRLRKKAGWSQEDLADRMDVTRQSVSKWESGQSVPDLEKVVRISDLFGVSTDYLLKDDVDDTEIRNDYGDGKKTDDVPALKCVSMDEAAAFLSAKSVTSGRIAFATFLCIISPVCLIILAALSEIPEYGIKDTVACGVGMIVMLALVAVAVAMYILSGRKTSAYTYLEREVFVTETGVRQMVEDCKKMYSKAYTAYNVAGACCCISAVIPLFVGIIFNEANIQLIVWMLGLMFVIIGIGVYLFIKCGIIWASYQKLLQEDEYSKERKMSRPIASAVSGIYWLVVTAIFICYSLPTNDWENSWVIWAVAGVLFPVAIAICNLIDKKR